MAIAVEASKGIMGHVALPQFSAMMAEVLLDRDDVAAAENWLTQATEFEDARDDRYFAAEVRRLSGVCLARRGRLDAAGDRLHEALAIARTQGATTFELRSALSLANVDLRAGRVAVRDVLGRFPEPVEWPEIAAGQTL